MDENAFDVPAGGRINQTSDPQRPDLAVAAPDERPVHKYNNNFYDLKDYNPNAMEGSTTIRCLLMGISQYADYLEQPIC